MKNKEGIWFFTCILWVMTTVALVGQENVHVNKFSEAQMESGSIANPFKTVERAVELSQPNSTINIFYW